MHHSTFNSTIWLSPSTNKNTLVVWHFVSVPPDLSAELKFLFQTTRKGFGSLPVKATIGNTTWQTSIFPSSKRAAYILPLKADVRKKENLTLGDMIDVTLEIK